jgi:AcrR family transcriptional regulator
VTAFSPSRPSPGAEPEPDPARSKPKKKTKNTADLPLRQGAATREEILEVATQEFAQHGLSGARMDRIAQKIAASKRMIYYYFKSKDALYQAVLEKSYRDIRDHDANIDFAALDPVEAIRAIIEATLDHEFSHPEFIRLVINENILRARFLSKLPDMRRSNRIIIKRLESILERGQKAGLFRKDIDAIELHMVISAMCVFKIANRHTFKALFGRDMASPKLRRRIKDVISDAVIRLISI